MGYHLDAVLTRDDNDRYIHDDYDDNYFPTQVDYSALPPLPPEDNIITSVHQPEPNSLEQVIFEFFIGIACFFVLAFGIFIFVGLRNGELRFN